MGEKKGSRIMIDVQVSGSRSNGLTWSLPVLLLVPLLAIGCRQQPESQKGGSKAGGDIDVSDAKKISSDDKNCEADPAWIENAFRGGRGRLYCRQQLFVPSVGLPEFLVVDEPGRKHGPAGVRGIRQPDRTLRSRRSYRALSRRRAR